MLFKNGFCLSQYKKTDIYRLYICPFDLLDRLCFLYCSKVKVSFYCWIITGCQEIADEFRSQEIDGQAMLLLKEDHLMSAMNIKLGPALKIFARINMLKDS